MADPRMGGSPHDLLLALAGRVDDDLMAWCRELVAVGEEDRAVELACAALAADRTPLPPAVRDALVTAARTARTDLDADAALPPAVDVEIPHRFDTALPVVDELAAAVAALPARQVAGCRLHVTARTTPAGAAPGPLPQPVVVAEVGPDDPRPLDVLAYQLAIACARAGVPAAVEVVVAGAVLPDYQRAALHAAWVSGGDHDPGRSSSRPAAPRAARPRATTPPARPAVAPPGVAEAEPAAGPRPAAGPGRAGAAPATGAQERAVAASGPAGPGAGSRSSLADRMTAWDTATATASTTTAPTAPTAAAEPAAPVRATGADVDAAGPATGDPARTAGPSGPAADRPAATGRRLRVDADPLPADPRSADPSPADPAAEHPAAAGRGPAGTGPLDAPARRADRTAGGTRRATAPDPGDTPDGPLPLGDGPSGDRPEPVPFARVDSGPVSFEPASPDPAAASEDERPRWPASGGLVLPRRRPAGPAEEEPPPEPTRRPTALRSFLRPAPDPAGPPPSASGEEATVRPLRPGPPDASTPPTEPLAAATGRPAPEPVIDEDDPLGLGPTPLSPEEPAADPWHADWRTGEWAVRPAPPVETPHPAADDSGPLLPAETTARLNDDDRELLARLQAELRAGARPRVTPRAAATPNGRAPTPPDLAG